MVFIAATVPLLLSGNTKRSEFRMAPVDSPLKVAYSKVSSRTHHHCVTAENVFCLYLEVVKYTPLLRTPLRTN